MWIFARRHEDAALAPDYDPGPAPDEPAPSKAQGNRI